MSASFAAARRPRRPAALRRLCLHDGGRLAHLEELLGRTGGEQVHAAGDDPGPAGLMARAEPGAVVAVEVLVEQDEIAPVGVLLELRAPSVYRPPPILASQEDAGQPARDLLGNLVQVHEPSGARGALDVKSLP